MEPQEIDSALDELENRLDRLRSLYEQYFMGIEKIEPTVPRKDVDRRFWILRRTQIRNTARRFRLQTLVQRYNTFQQHWTRICREIENGTYVRHLLKARKNLGAEPKTWAAKKRLGLLRRDKQGSEAPPADGAAVGANGSASAPPSAYPSAPPATPTPSEPPARPSTFTRPSRQAELTPLDLEFDEAPTLPPRAAEPRSSVPQRPSTAKPPIPTAAKPAVPAPAVPAAAKPALPVPSVPTMTKPVVPASSVPVKPSGLPLPRPGLPARPPGGGPAPGGSLVPGIPRPRPSLAPAVPQAASAIPQAKPAAPNGPAAPAPRPPVPAAGPSVARPPTAAPVARPPTAAPVARPPTAAPVARPPAPAPAAPERPAPAERPAAAPAPRPVPAAAAPAPKPAGSSGLSDERVRQLHQELAAARKQLNQSSNLSVDSLAKSLRDTENKLRTQHGGRSVDFQVVIKDGKPIVKPVVRR